MNISQIIEKIQSLPDEQRKAIFLTVMTIVCLIAIIWVITITDSGITKITSKINLPSAPLYNTQETQIDSAPENDVMTGTNNNPAVGNSTMSSGDAGFSPNEVFNFNQNQ